MDTCGAGDKNYYEILGVLPAAVTPRSVTVELPVTPEEAHQGGLCEFTLFYNMRASHIQRRHRAIVGSRPAD